jgi:ATP-dependent Clp protease protease subunit
MTDFIVKTSSGSLRATSFERLLMQRVVCIEGEITDDTAQEIVRQLLVLDIESGDNVTLLINSPGGSAQGGMAIIDTIRVMRSKVIAVCTGCAYSMAAAVFACCFRRIMLEHSSLMIHNGLHISVTKGGDRDIEVLCSDIKRSRESYYKVLADSCNKTVDEISQCCTSDYYMDPVQALDFGLSDETASNLDIIREVL